MKKQLLIFCLPLLGLLIPETARTQSCSTTTTPQMTVMSGLTANIMSTDPFTIHICTNAIAYDTLGGGSHEYHMEPGSALYIRLNNTTFVYMQQSAYLDHFNDNGTLMISYEAGATIVNHSGPMFPPCPSVTFPPATCLMSIDDLVSKTGLNLYPNPAVNELHLLYKGSSGELKAEITDLLGRVVDVLTLEANKPATYSTAKLQEAVYFVTVKKDGQIVEKKKLMVVR